MRNLALSRSAPRTPHRTRPQDGPGPYARDPLIRPTGGAGAYRGGVPLRTADDYRESLRDGRTLYYRGRRVDDVTAEPELRVAVDHAALDYEVAHDPAYQDLSVAKDPDTGGSTRRTTGSRAAPTTWSPARS